MTPEEALELQEYYPADQWMDIAVVFMGVCPHSQWDCYHFCPCCTKQEKEDQMNQQELEHIQDLRERRHEVVVELIELYAAKAKAVHNETISMYSQKIGGLEIEKRDLNKQLTDLGVL